LIFAQGTWRLHIFNRNIYRDLVNIGLKPHKSLDVHFPKVPKVYLSHFIRGCWDGDGSVGFYEGRYSARFFCGSLSFIGGLAGQISRAGLPQRRIQIRYTRRGNPFYTIKFGQKDTARLYEFLYKDTDSSYYLERKFKLFRSAYDKQKAKEALDKTSNYPQT
jgi:hypothetical protein